MKTICMMREVFKAIGAFEEEFQQTYDLSLNEAMILCALNETGTPMTSTALSKRTELRPSHTSKTIRSLENKTLIKRTLSDTDKRLMYFSLSKTGKDKIENLSLEQVEVPDLLKPLFE